jgi:hypothetical protein
MKAFTTKENWDNWYSVFEQERTFIVYHNFGSGQGTKEYKLTNVFVLLQDYYSSLLSLTEDEGLSCDEEEVYFSINEVVGMSMQVPIYQTLLQDNDFEIDTSYIQLSYKNAVEEQIELLNVNLFENKRELIKLDVFPEIEDDLWPTSIKEFAWRYRYAPRKHWTDFILRSAER